MYGRIGDNNKVLATPDARANCPMCDQELLAKSGEIRIWHWEHEGADCDPWAEPENEWHLGWKRRVPAERVEVVKEVSGVKHRAEVVCANGAILMLRSSGLLATEVAAREAFYGHGAWLFCVSWADELQYGKRGFWWKRGAVAQTMITKPLFWHFESEDLVQEIKLKRVESGRVLGRAVKTHQRERFATFVATGALSR